ncbi:MAG: hypothetical protein M1819_007187 [Sarea resinae]|nr:MAG: hypothetical protein M1819_007187 [Sarea resinae]
MASSYQSSQALTKRPSDTSLMPPPPPPKRIKRPSTVLDEDCYTDALSHIIARDFFPGLLETQTQQEYLDALDSRDGEWIKAASRKLTEVMTPGPDGRRKRFAAGRRGTSLTPRIGLSAGDETPRGWGGDTPMSVAGSDISTVSTTTTEAQQPEIDTNMSLTAFQAKYTSEDNESFNKLLDKQNAKHAENYAWIYAGNKIPAARQIAHRAREQKLLADKTARAIEDGRADTDKEQGQSERISGDDDNRKAMPDSWRSRPENQLMFHPASLEERSTTSSLPTVQETAEATSKAPPKSVSYTNTRLPPPPTSSESSIPPSPSLSTINDAIAGRPRPTASEPGYTGAETLRVAGYAFVDEEPTPSELGVSEEDGEQPHLFLLAGHGGDSSGPHSANPFTINESSRREKIHHRMVDRVARNHRKPSLSALSPSSPSSSSLSSFSPSALSPSHSPSFFNRSKTPTPKFTSSPRLPRPATHRAGNLTPAARQLWNRVGASKAVSAATTTTTTTTPTGAGVNGALFGRSRGTTTTTIAGKEKEKDKTKGRWTPSPSLRGRGMRGASVTPLRKPMDQEGANGPGKSASPVVVEK